MMSLWFFFVNYIYKILKKNVLRDRCQIQFGSVCFISVINNDAEWSKNHSAHSDAGLPYSQIYVTDTHTVPHGMGAHKGVPAGKSLLAIP
jgi:hypothetical protein